MILNAANTFEHRIQTIEATVRSWEYRSATSDPADELTARLDQLIQSYFSRLYDKACRGVMDPRVKVNLARTSLMTHWDQVSCPEKTGWIEIGVLGTAGNPITWGHLLMLFAALGTLDLDLATLLIHGAIRYKSAVGAYPEAARLHMAQMLIQPHLEPFVRFSDLGSGSDSGKSSEEVLHQLFEINLDRRISIRSLTGWDGDEVFRAKLHRYYRYGRDYQLREHQNRQLTIHVLGRSAADDRITESTLNALSAELAKEYELREPIRVCLHADIAADLGISSTLFRQTADPHLVPAPIYRYIRCELLNKQVQE